MGDRSPTIEEWRTLYEAAIEFKKIACWDWMYDSDLFGVQNPDDGQVGYCCVLGNFGEMFGMIMYLGSEGLEGYLKLQSGEIAETDPHAIHYQKCLMISFEDRNYLQQEDIQLIKKLGLKFRGRNEWPLFRSCRPGYLSWFLREKEALFLTVAIEQAVDVALRFKEDRNLLTAPDEDEYLIRVPDKIENVLLWEDKWMKPVPVENTGVFDERVDEVRIQKIKKGASRTGSVWEIEFTFAPMPVREEKERPYFPKMFAVMDHRSMMALDLHMFERGSDISEFRNHFLSFLEEIGILPQQILIAKEETLHIIAPIASLLKIRVKSVSRLSVFEELLGEIVRTV